MVITLLLIETVQKISMRYLKIRQHVGFLYTVLYSNITELHNGNRGRCRVIESLVLNYRQNPEEAFKVMEDVANTCNEKYREFLLEDADGIPVESFKFNQIIELNVDFRGHRYSFSCFVNEAVETGKKVRYELALAAFENNLEMAESLSSH
ncbi:hypothetical protein [Peribacillus glennii]|uniref:hypothetical protein n=1 Tax=Peribacillus glennii TaxID=2303991 RepID=UPI001F2BCA90|nr:hypothetical protein [Peribacillus glennii]